YPLVLLVEDSSPAKSAKRRNSRRAIPATSSLVLQQKTAKRITPWLICSAGSRNRRKRRLLRLHWLGCLHRNLGLYQSRGPRNCIDWKKTSEQSTWNCRLTISANWTRSPQRSRCKVPDTPKSYKNSWAAEANANLLGAAESSALSEEDHVILCISG